jgi:hypothetical protein
MSIIDVEQQILQFEGHRIDTYFVEKEDKDWDIICRGSQVERYLLYTNPAHAVREHVEEENQYNLKKLYNFLKKLREKIRGNLK